MTVVPSVEFKPHEHGPESIESILRKTTRKPLYCHPKAWCDTHLDVLRVEGLDKEYPVEHVLGFPVALDPADTALVQLIDQIPNVGEREGYIRITLQVFARMSKTYTSSFDAENHVTGICYAFLDHLREKVRKYPRVEHHPFRSYESVKFSAPRWEPPSLYLYYGKGEEQQKMELKTQQITYDFPNYDEGFPHNFFPIITSLCWHHDHYNDWKTDRSERQEAKRMTRWKKASKSAEMTAVLLSMAQKQALRLVDSRPEHRCCPNAICPILIWATKTHVRLVRGHVPLSHLDALANPDRPVFEALKLEISLPFDFLETEDQRQVLLALSALLDNYFLTFRSRNLIDDGSQK
ncbi:hypothetical protein FQN55_003759 [Onygenales sp. PD_40]|nr:hypothetical protein FQN55_003759 [Onygenales sp. PD_40]KAK2778667.1 hypothetical protein FQN52_002701 [Onygenales sp. PD_12]